MKILYFFLFLWVIFALWIRIRIRNLNADPDPATQIIADPCGFGYRSGSATLEYSGGKGNHFGPAGGSSVNDSEEVFEKLKNRKTERPGQRTNQIDTNVGKKRRTGTGISAAWSSAPFPFWQCKAVADQSGDKSTHFWPAETGAD
jgi:hypothetical protein